MEICKNYLNITSKTTAPFLRSHREEFKFSSVVLPSFPMFFNFLLWKFKTKLTKKAQQLIPEAVIATESWSNRFKTD